MTDYTIPLDDELKSQLESCSKDDDDDWDWDAPYTDEEEFYSPENVARILESVKQAERGEVVTMTLDKMKAMLYDSIDSDEKELYDPVYVEKTLESLKQFEEGKFVTVTLDELKAMGK